MNDEAWKLKRAGMITASRLEDICTASGKWTQASVSYLYQLQRERTLGYPVVTSSSKAMDWGNENEPYAIEWLRENYSPHVRHYDRDFGEKVFLATDWGYGCSPDADITDADGRTVELIEIKCPYRSQELYTMFSPTLPYAEKKKRVMKEHGTQMAGQLLLFPDVQRITLLKYDAMDDDDPNDTRSPLDMSRGITFTFRRDEFDLEEMERRIRFADAYLRAGKDLEKIQKEWEGYVNATYKSE